MNESIAKIEDDQTLLMVSHGGVVASSLLSCVDTDLSHLNPWFSYCEGYKLEYDGKWRLGKLLEL